MTALQAAVVNQALEAIGAQTQITDLGDGTVAGNAAQVIYTPTVDLLLRQEDPDFARRNQVLSLVGMGSLAQPWVYEYVYPIDCLRLREIAPNLSDYNPLDPYPVLREVAVDVINGVPMKVIYCNQPNAIAVYTSSLLTEQLWDSIFREAVVRQLANPLSMALAGRPDFARELLTQAQQYEQLSGQADESIIR